MLRSVVVPLGAEQRRDIYIYIYIYILLSSVSIFGVDVG
jgi:hypothetical protein